MIPLIDLTAQVRAEQRRKQFARGLPPLWLGFAAGVALTVITIAIVHVLTR